MPISTDRVIRRVSTRTVSEDYPTKVGPLDGVDLGFAGQSTQHSTHALHPYVAAINPPLARAIIETYVPKDRIVLDPFVGGGAVLLEAMLSGRAGVGFDVNPLAVMLSKAKTTRLSARVLKRAINAAVSSVPETSDTTRMPLLAKPSSIDLSAVPELVRFWYRDENARDLLVLRDSIKANATGEEKWALRTALSATARDSMLTYRGEVRLRRLTGRDLERFEADTLLLFRKRADLLLDRIPVLPDGCPQTIESGDVMTMDGRVAEGSCHSVVCSPPYADDKNGVGYFQFSRNMLYWVGLSLEDVAKAKSKFLGADVCAREMPPSKTLELCLESVRERSQRHYLEGLAFYADYYKAIRQMLRAVQHRVIIVIGNRVLARTFFDTARITVEFALDLGATFEHYYSRNIRKKRIPNLGGDGGGGEVEHIIVLRK